jgi:cysteine dioxygenase
VSTESNQDFASILERSLNRLESVTSGDISRLLGDLTLARSYLEPWVAASGEKPYGRKCLFSNEKWECLLMTWNAFRLCAPHDHGKSRGWIALIQGGVINRRYEWCESRNELILKDEIEAFEGDILLAPLGMVHDMKATGSRLLSLHFYTPPISGMRVFNLEQCLTCKVADDCGAWWEEDQRKQFELMKFQLSH